MAEVAEMIARDKAGVPVYNAEWNEAKSYGLSRAIESDYEEVKEQFRDRRGQVPWQLWDGGLYWIDTGTPYPNQVDGRIAKIRAVLAAKGHQEALDTYPVLREMAAAILELFESFAPICRDFLAIRPRLVKGKKPSAYPKITPDRTLDNTGTCGVCTMNVKREANGGLYHHRFTVHYGQREGKCFGTGYQPIELSPKVLEDYLEKVLRPYLSACQTRLGLVSDTMMCYEITSSHRLQPYVSGRLRLPMHFHKEDPLFETVRAEEIAHQHRLIRSTQSDIVALEKRIVEWTAKPLPEPK